MPVFYFQQYAGRPSKRGQHWLELSSAVPADWLSALDRVLAESGIVPNSGKAIRCQGGVCLFRAKNMGALFTLHPAPPGYKDYNGRTDGVVINALFFKPDSLSAGKSLKKAWDHPALRILPQEAAVEQFFIQLDENMGSGESERSFFQHLSEHYQSETVILYPCMGAEPRIVSLVETAPEKNIKDVETTTGAPSQKSYSQTHERHFVEAVVKNQFVWGVIVGIILCVGSFVYYQYTKAAPKTPVSQAITMDIPLEKIQKGQQEYYLPLIVKVKENGDQKYIEIKLDSKSKQ